MKDLSLNIWCDSDDTTICGLEIYPKIIRDSVVTRHKCCPSCQKKQRHFKKPKQKLNNASKSTTVELILLHQSNLISFNTFILN